MSSAAPLSASSSARLGTIALVIRAIAVLGVAVLETSIGPPPSEIDALPAWVAAHHVGLAWVDELAVIGAAALVPAAIGLFRAHGAGRRPAMAAAWGLLATIAPIVITLGAVHGRLVYPVFGLDVSSDPRAVALVLTVWIGGMHAVALVMAASSAFAAFALAGERRALAVLAIVTSVTQVLASFPWLLPPPGWLAAAAIQATWCVALAVDLRARREA